MSNIYDKNCQNYINKRIHLNGVPVGMIKEALKELSANPSQEGCSVETLQQIIDEMEPIVKAKKVTVAVERMFGEGANQGLTDIELSLSALKRYVAQQKSSVVVTVPPSEKSEETVPQRDVDATAYVDTTVAATALPTALSSEPVPQDLQRTCDISDAVPEMDTVAVEPQHEAVESLATGPQAQVRSRDAAVDESSEVVEMLPTVSKEGGLLKELVDALKGATRVPGSSEFFVRGKEFSFTGYASAIKDVYNERVTSILTERQQRYNYEKNNRTRYHLGPGSTLPFVGVLFISSYQKPMPQAPEVTEAEESSMRQVIQLKQQAKTDLQNLFNQFRTEAIDEQPQQSFSLSRWLFKPNAYLLDTDVNSDHGLGSEEEQDSKLLERFVGNRKQRLEAEEVKRLAEEAKRQAEAARQAESAKANKAIRANGKGALYAAAGFLVAGPVGALAATNSSANSRDA